jgi:predicted DCC family thiol-disulfide oxidoreductase YuxK
MNPRFPLTLFVDGACPLCAREIRWLERKAQPSRLQLVDISAADFSTDGLGVSLDQLRARLHARSASGDWLTGLDATYWSWRAAGHGFWAAPLGWRPLRPLLLLAYWLFSLARPHLDWLPHPDGSRRCKDHCETRP